MATRTYSNIAPPRALAGGATSGTNMGSTDMSFSVSASTTGYPATGPFLVTIDRGTSSQEVILCSSVNTSTNVFTVATGGRGYDGTTATTHILGAVVEHTSAAIDYREPNTYINTYTSQGDLIVGGASGVGTYARLGLGTTGQVLTSNGTTATWATAPINTGPSGATGPTGATGVTGPSGGTGAAGPINTPPHIEAYNSGSDQTLSGVSGTSTVTTSATTNFYGSNPPTVSNGVATIHQSGLYLVTLLIELMGTLAATIVTPQLLAPFGSGTQVYRGSSAVNFGYGNTNGFASIVVPIVNAATITAQVTYASANSGGAVLKAGQSHNNFQITYLGPIS